MNLKRRIIPLVSLVVLLPGAGLVVTTAGCAGPGHGAGGVVVDLDDYDYYPGYEVYYSRRHHDYYYQDGHVWVRRPTPPKAFGPGPSVHMDFRDAPEHHHADVVRRYPHNWQPEKRHDDRKDDDDRRRDQH
ncbi:MAG TPA: hypothetical protein VHD61_00770 [Lacunisphaera sp.]|nr:hypothetical protein [Lacunisphaera sp.]